MRPVGVVLSDDVDGLVWFEIEIPMVKLLRAHGGCLGIGRR